MRILLFAELLLVTLTGCIHLPPEVAAVVREADPPGHNHFLPVTHPVTQPGAQADQPPARPPRWTAARGVPDDP